MNDRRSIQRFLLSLTANLLIKGDGQPERAVQAVTSNISSDGALYRTEEEIPLGSKVSCQIFMNPNNNNKAQDSRGVR